MSIYLRATILFSCILMSLSYGQSNKTQLLDYSYSGSGKAGSSGNEFVEVMAHPEVQRALLEVATAPRNQVFLDDALKGTGVTLELLQRLRLIRHEGENYVLGFALLTNADLDKIRSIAEVEGKSLAAALLIHRTEIQKILAGRVQPGVDWKAMAYFILGYASLDNDGLILLREKGYLAVPGKEQYIPFARQLEGGGSIQGLYWGSNSYHDEISFTSFGDHQSLPRYALPDVLDYLKSTLREKNTPKSLQSDLVDAARILIRKRAGMVMLAFRDGEKTKDQLAKASGLTKDETTKLLNLLLELNYIRSEDSCYTTIIPVLDERDSSMVKELRRLGHEVTIKWLNEHYEGLCSQLGELRFVRYGVPLPEGFYWVWHYLFGITNRELVAAGLFADPYDSTRTFKGFIPAVYLLDVVQGPF